MKKLLTLLFISISSFTFAQAKKDAPAIKFDSARANPIQIQRLSKSDSVIRANQKQFVDMLEFVFGCKIEDVEEWKIENGYFKWKLKHKKP